MANVSVNSAIVKNGIEVCNEVMQDLDRLISYLEREYQRAQQSWKDSKAAQANGIVYECISMLKRPIGELGDCRIKLMELETAISNYENTNF